MAEQYGSRELGARSVTGIEVGSDMVDEARDFAASKGERAIQFVLAEGEDLPFADQTFDVVCSYDVFEHVADLSVCLQECYRVLRPGGVLYGVFPREFHHPTGGSHLHGYISRITCSQCLISVLRDNEGCRTTATRARPELQTPSDTAQRPSMECDGRLSADSRICWRLFLSAISKFGCYP